MSSRANGAPNVFQFGGGESKDLWVHLGTFAMNFRLTSPGWVSISGFSAVRCTALSACLLASGLDAPAQSSEIVVTPAIVEAGSPELIQIEAPATAKLDGEWLGRKLAFFRGHDNRTWFALAGVDV